MNIRMAQKSDIPRLNHLLYQVHKVHADERPDLFRPGCKKYTSEDLQEILQDPQKPIYVAVDENDSVMGYCFCLLEEVPEGTSLVPRKSVYIDDLCVDETCRGQHIGSLLYEHVVQQARNMGCYHITLNVWTLNPTAQAFYEKMGMKPLKTVMEQIL